MTEEEIAKLKIHIEKCNLYLENKNDYPYGFPNPFKNAVYPLIELLIEIIAKEEGMTAQKHFDEALSHIGMIKAHWETIECLQLEYRIHEIDKHLKKFAGKMKNPL